MHIVWYVYRLYSVNSLLLYVGKTYSTESRFSRHSTTQPWWDEVCIELTHVETYATEAAALSAETYVIKTEHPKYNKQHNRTFRLPSAIRRKAHRDIGGIMGCGRPIDDAIDLWIAKNSALIVDDCSTAESNKSHREGREDPSHLIKSMVGRGWSIDDARDFWIVKDPLISDDLHAAARKLKESEASANPDLGSGFTIETKDSAMLFDLESSCSVKAS